MLDDAPTIIAIAHNAVMPRLFEALIQGGALDRGAAVRLVREAAAELSRSSFADRPAAGRFLLKLAEEIQKGNVAADGG